MKRQLLAVITLVFAGSGLANAAMYLYDDFSNATVSDTLWTKTTSGAGTVAWTGGYAALDMTTATGNKQAVMQMNQAINLASATDSVRITWDMYLATPTPTSSQGYFNGLSIGTSGTNLKVGQKGYAAGVRWGPYIGATGNPSGALGQQWLHYDLTVTSTSQTLKLYVRNNAYDSNPTLYAGGTANWTQAISNITLATGTDLQLRLWVNDPYTIDTFSQRRDLVEVDNVFTSIPEPASLALALLGGAVVCLGRKGRRGTVSGHQAA